MLRPITPPPIAHGMRCVPGVDVNHPFHTSQGIIIFSLLGETLQAQPYPILSTGGGEV